MHPPSQFTYTYTANSNLIANVSGPVHTVTNTWETDRDILASKENEVGTTNVSTYSYGVNLIGQRTNVAKSGTAFAGSRDIAWGYDSLGQVTKADSTIPGLDRAYQFDQIGNRLKSADSLTLPTANNYTPNALNQYTAINALTPSYDDDGNMTGGPLPANLSANSTLTWDGENRLISSTVNSITTTYAYDSQSRRIAIWGAGLQPASSPPGTVYVYDGWNPIAKYGASHVLTKTYTWGTDLSGNMQGAGGVGGLLAVADGTGTHYPTYDGNGNVSEYLDGTGVVVAHYEYDPFGRTTVATGPKAGDFSHRFSTKPLDAETGLYYYGYRYYDPETGRWPSRDPIGEEGGVNLYAFVGNDGVGKIDILGMYTESEVIDAVFRNYGEKAEFVFRQMKLYGHEFKVKDELNTRLFGFAGSRSENFDGGNRYAHIDCDAVDVDEAAKWAMDAMRLWANSGLYGDRYYKQIIRKWVEFGPDSGDTGAILGSTLDLLHMFSGNEADEPILVNMIQTDTIYSLYEYAFIRERGEPGHPHSNTSASRAVATTAIIGQNGRGPNGLHSDFWDRWHPEHDQAHHFAKFFSLGGIGGGTGTELISILVARDLRNPGDRRLALVANWWASKYSSSPDYYGQQIEQELKSPSNHFR